MFSIFLLLINVFIDAKPTDTSLGNRKEYTELSFNGGFFTKVSKNKELKSVSIYHFTYTKFHYCIICKRFCTWDKGLIIKLLLELW